ncbi:hypothetical protein SAICODRAFT_21566 [Saitoella complicata NRRL Y-17804]|uniref:uncharacterized protein n=1 Tax=Saitoella complicata (strain BCRC 22490 / CBS 7301 / JCM 7358 / NBRC 10748 / NRRL Y-17804) TaxID=698492 RepID=UPI000866C214|nr:uncharacterized protein SAICODRAFT_21566 [Saitoella complicata NRRL Y-17804]ODQ50603.1 hypothetical protein SAICODRAFT_21566 [Saitoella complicata NRRL Y-17804]
MPSTLSTDLLTPHPNPYTPDYRPLLLLTSSSLTFILALLSAFPKTQQTLEEFGNITRHKLREKGLASPEVEEQEVEVDFGSMWTQLWKEIREGNTKEENELMDKGEAEKASVSA